MKCIEIDVINADVSKQQCLQNLYYAESQFYGQLLLFGVGRHKNIKFEFLIMHFLLEHSAGPLSL